MPKGTKKLTHSSPLETVARFVHHLAEKARNKMWRYQKARQFEDPKVTREMERYAARDYGELEKAAVSLYRLAGLEVPEDLGQR